MGIRPLGPAIPKGIYELGEGFSEPVRLNLNDNKLFEWGTCAILVTAKTGTDPVLNTFFEYSSDKITWAVANAPGFIVTDLDPIPSLFNYVIPFYQGQWIRVHWVITGTANPTWEFMLDYNLML